MGAANPRRSWRARCCYSQTGSSTPSTPACPTPRQCWSATTAASPHLAHGASPRADLFRRTIRERFVEQAPGQSILAEPDALAVAAALEPGIIKQSEPQYVEIELAGQLTRGQTVVDWYSLTDHPHNADLVLEIDRDRFWELMQLSLS